MRGRLAVRRRRLILACRGDRRQVRAIESMLAEQGRAKRHRRQELRRWAAL